MSRVRGASAACRRFRRISAKDRLPSHVCARWLEGFFGQDALYDCRCAGTTRPNRLNEFKIVLGRENDFEQLWRNRESHLGNVEGFIKFNLLKGSTNDDYTVYISHSLWTSKGDFTNWTKSESFRLAHKDAGKNSQNYIGHPVFEGYEVVV